MIRGKRQVVMGKGPRLRRDKLRNKANKIQGKVRQGKKQGTASTV